MQSVTIRIITDYVVRDGRANASCYINIGHLYEGIIGSVLKINLVAAIFVNSALRDPFGQKQVC